MKLRDYQEELVRRTLAEVTSKARVVMVCPTGSGKTIMATTGILPNLKGSTVWVTHRRELAEQVNRSGEFVPVFMVQGETPEGFDNVIIDEGHHVCAKQYRDILGRNPDANVIAMTATPYRLDGAGLGSCGFTRIIHGPDTYTLTESGFLCPVRVFILVSEQLRAWTPAAAANRIAAASFTKGVAFCRSIREAEQLAELVSASGVPAGVVDGSMTRSSRHAVVRDFRKGKIRLVCNHTVFTEGVDVPDIDLVVLNRSTLSRCLWKQMVGRGTRNAPGKDSCLVLDLAGNGVRHGSIYDREIYDLNGMVESTESRELSEQPDARHANQYNYNDGEELKEWKPKPKPVRLIENLQRLRSASPLHRLRTA